LNYELYFANRDEFPLPAAQDHLPFMTHEMRILNG